MPMAASIILLPFYSNFLSSPNFVALSFYISISLFLQIIFSFSLDTYFGVKYTQLSAKPEEQKKFVGTVAAILLLGGVIIITLLLLSGPWIFPMIFDANSGVEFGYFAIASIVTAFFNSFFKTATNSLIYFNKPGLFLSFNLINFIATISISVAGLYLHPDSISGPINGRLFSGVIIFLLGLYVFKSNATWEFEKYFLKEIVSFCSPYLLFVISIWAVSNIDRFFLVSSVNSTRLAAYDQLLKCFIGIEFLQNSISAIIFPKVFELWSKNGELKTTKETNRYFNVFTALNICWLIIFCLVIPVFIKVFIPKEEYYHSFDYIGLISAGYTLRSILNFYLSSILYSKSIKNLLKIFFTSSVVQISLTFFMVKQMGLLGAIYAGIITKMVQVLFSYLFTRTVFTYEFNFFKIYCFPFLYLLLNIVCYTYFDGYNIWVYLGQFFLFSIAFYFAFRKEIIVVINQFLLKKKE
jgi:O-antigen/teichoic acid export membrane protein